MLAAGALLVLAAVLGWQYRRRRAKPSTGVVSEPSGWGQPGAPSGGPAADGDSTDPGGPRPTWAAVASELPRRPRRVLLLGLAAAALVAAPAVLPVSPLLWLLLFIGLCLATPFVWNAASRGGRREEGREPLPGQRSEDAPTLEIDAALIRSAVEASDVDDTVTLGGPTGGLPGRTPGARLDRRGAAVAFLSAVALVVALAVVLVGGGHAPAPDHRTARASVPAPAPASTPSSAPPATAPATTPVTAAPPAAEPTVTVNPPAPTPTPSAGPPPSSGENPLSALLQALP